MFQISAHHAKKDSILMILHCVQNARRIALIAHLAQIVKSALMAIIKIMESVENAMIAVVHAKMDQMHALNATLVTFSIN